VQYAAGVVAKDGAVVASWSQGAGTHPL